MYTTVPVSKGDVVTVIVATDDLWLKVRSETTGQEGFVPRSFIALSDSTGSNRGAQASPMRGGGLGLEKGLAAEVETI